MENSNIKILLVDDEQDILEFVGYNLKAEGYQVFKASDGYKAIEIARTEIPNLILLDVMMPDMEGIEVCEKIRQDDRLKNIIIAFFTARGEDYSQVAGFEAGADDYITKPIRPKVLVSKIKSLLRRSNNIKNYETDITISKEEYAVFKGDEKIVLPKKEFELLTLLASEPYKVFKRDVILDKVWGNEVVVVDRTIDVHIRKLRGKIGDKYIQTLKGVGYKFTP